MSQKSLQGHKIVQNSALDALVCSWYIHIVQLLRTYLRSMCTSLQLHIGVYYYSQQWRHGYFLAEPNGYSRFKHVYEKIRQPIFFLAISVLSMRITLFTVSVIHLASFRTASWRPLCWEWMRRSQRRRSWIPALSTCCSCHLFGYFSFCIFIEKESRIERLQKGKIEK